MKKIISIILIAFISNMLKAQILHPVHWSYAAKRINKTETVLLIKASIDGNWHIYSLNQKDGGPIKTSLEFTQSKAYTIIGKPIEPKPMTKYEKTFSMDVNYFEKSVIFSQKVMLTSKDAIVRGKVNFMTCNDEKCLPPDELEFSIPVK